MDMGPTFDLLTSHSREEEISTKLVQPPWFRLSKFLIYILFSISFVAGALKFQYDSFNCNVIECIYNETITSLQACPQFKTQSLDADATYNFISDKCRDQNVHWVFEIIPFLYFIIAMILWNCSSLWLNIPGCTIYIERFVGLVTDCNAAIETSGWVYKDYVKRFRKTVKKQAERNHTGSSFCRMFCNNKVWPGNDKVPATNEENMMRHRNAMETSGWICKDSVDKLEKPEKKPVEWSHNGSSFCPIFCKNKISPEEGVKRHAYPEDDNQPPKNPELEQLDNKTSPESDKVPAIPEEDVKWRLYPEDENQLKDPESEQLNNLHDRLSHMMTDEKNHHVSVILVVQQFILTFLSLIFYFGVSCAFFWFDFLRSEYTCILDEYSRIACYYRLYTVYWFLAILFCTCICFHCFLSCVHLCWVIYHSTTHVQSTFPLPKILSRDLPLLLNLVTTNDRFFCERMTLFMAEDSKNEVTIQVTLSFENLQKLVHVTDGERLTLYNLTRRPQSFDRLHQLKYLQVLQLINCNLTEIPRCILKKCEALERADFTCNKIQTIIPNSQTSNNTTTLCTLILDKNPVLPSTLIHLDKWPIRSVSFVEHPAQNAEKEKFANELHEVIQNKNIHVYIDEQLFQEIQELVHLVEVKDGKVTEESRFVYKVQNRYDLKRSIAKLRESISPMDNPTFDDPIMHQLFMLEKALDQSNDCQQVVDEFNVFIDFYQPHSDRLCKKCQKIIKTLTKQVNENFKNTKWYEVDNSDRHNTGSSTESQQHGVDKEDPHDVHNTDQQNPGPSPEPQQHGVDIEDPHNLHNDDRHSPGPSTKSQQHSVDKKNPRDVHNDDRQKPGPSTKSQQHKVDKKNPRDVHNDDRQKLGPSTKSQQHGLDKKNPRDGHNDDRQKPGPSTKSQQHRVDKDNPRDVHNDDRQKPGPSTKSQQHRVDKNNPRDVHNDDRQKSASYTESQQHGIVIEDPNNVHNDDRQKTGPSTDSQQNGKYMKHSFFDTKVRNNHYPCSPWCPSHQC